MFIVIKTLHSIFKLLNSETSPIEIAAGLAFGMIVGLTPVANLHNLVIFLLVCLLRVNLGTFFLSLALFKIVGWLMDPIWDGLGYVLLVNFRAARPLWVTLTSGPILPFFRFNNTIVIGSLIASLVLYIPIFTLGVMGVRSYRMNLRHKWQDSKAMKIMRATPFYGMYEKYQSARAKFGI